MANPQEAVSSSALAQFATVELKARKIRELSFPRGVAGEPAWNMLLDLYVSESKRQKTQTSYLIAESGAAHATGHRHLEYLLHEGLVRRTISEDDRRSKYVELTEQGYIKMESYLSEYLSQIRRLQEG